MYCVLIALMMTAKGCPTTVGQAGRLHLVLEDVSRLSRMVMLLLAGCQNVATALASLSCWRALDTFTCRTRRLLTPATQDTIVVCAGRARPPCALSACDPGTTAV